LAKDFDLDDPDALTSSIEKSVASFIDEIGSFLAEREPLKNRRISPRFYFNSF
jgi:hypothetical protein